ncbi:CHAT domain-containing protein [Streptomyces armeniacus]|uniref:CHAT domain-containing protein n=1 Tax=Streptomyces armeniacus TaxID=83291 RepID=UPI001AD81285|nr:CHAT domain-containing protein [Streptomyces armeniacus]
MDEDPESGVHAALTADGAGQFAYPLAALVLMLLIVAMLRRRREDIRTGLAAWREHPVVLSAGALAWAAAPWCGALLWLLVRDWVLGVPAGRHLSRWVLADRPFAWFVGTLLAITAVFFAVIGPWLTDHLLRVLRYRRRLERLRRQGEDEALSRGILKLGEEIAERPYREQTLISLLLRIQAGRPQGELLDSVLRTLSRIPRLDEPGWLFRLSPLWDSEVRARLVLADALVINYTRTRARPHLDVALLLLEGLHRRPPVLAGRRARAAVALTLAWALGLRDTSPSAADGDDLGRAVVLAEQAAAVLPAETTGGTLGRLLVKRYERQADATTLDRAIDALRPAGRSPALIWALVLRHRATGEGNDLAEAVATAQDTVAEDPDSEEGLAMLLFTVTQVPAWLSGPERDLVADLLDAVDRLPDVSYPLNMVSALLRAALVVDEDDEAALSWYERALTLVEQSASLGLSLEDRKAQLGSMAPAPTTFADIALSIGQVERAVELLELGRTVIWSQTHRLRRSLAPPGEAARLEELRIALDRPGYPAPGRDDLLAGYHAAGARAELAATWEKLTAGQGSGRPMSFSELREAARGGPAVIINVSETGCAAVVVLADRDPVHIRLPDAEHDKLAGRAGGLLHPTLGPRRALSLARHLWDAIAAPVLEVVEPHLGSDRRVWWCPTGPLSAFPLHLAGHHDRNNGPALIDYVVSSYTPSLWALREARRLGPEAAVPAPPPALLAASLRETPGWPELEHAEEEAAVVSARFPAARTLSEQHVTVAATRAALYDHPWVHIACHGDQGGLVLRDGRLGMDELADMELKGGRLAFLSACVTALPDAQVVDEVLHPAAAFHLNGFSHVIGTMWQIVSSDAPTVADDFYRLLLTEGYGPASALHQAQRRLRAEHPGDPARWAPFVHMGP